MKRKSQNKGMNIIIYILFALLIVALVGFLSFFTNGFNNDFNSFYVTSNDKIYKYDNTSNLEIPNNVDVVFSCKYILSNLDKNMPKDYKVKIVPNVDKETNFDFFIDNQPYSFMAEDDFLTAFDITKNEDSFILKIPKNNSMYSIINKKYINKEVVLEKEIDTLKTSYFKLLILSYDEKTIIQIPITFYSEIGVEKIIIDKEEILI